MAPLQALRDCWMFSMWWMWCTGEQLWQCVSQDGGSLSLQYSPACLSLVNGVMVRAHMQTMMLCGGSVYKAEQMAHPLAVA